MINFDQKELKTQCYDWVVFDLVMLMHFDLKNLFYLSQQLFQNSNRTNSFLDDRFAGIDPILTLIRQIVISVIDLIPWRSTDEDELGKQLRSPSPPSIAAVKIGSSTTLEFLEAIHSSEFVIPSSDSPFLPSLIVSQMDLRIEDPKIREEIEITVKFLDLDKRLKTCCIKHVKSVKGDPDGGGGLYQPITN
ncbi:hypothetical protein LXL04_001711 [Taraxacum kok-saghyz]